MSKLLTVIAKKILYAEEIPRELREMADWMEKGFTEFAGMRVEMAFTVTALGRGH